MNKIEHIGIAVKSLERSSVIYEKLLGVKSYKQEAVESEAVNTLFFKLGDEKIELLEATAADSIFKEMQRLKREGFRLLSETPKAGADNKLVCFVHPKDTNGVLIELCQPV